MTSTEQQRRAYLDAMGIDVWVARDAADPEETLEADGAGHVAADGLDWGELRECVANCIRCELSASRTQTVFGAGNPSADWMVVGEAPGAEEDRRGEPFVGRAGQLLNEMLNAIGQSRDDVFIANILKCRPPNNRDPQPSEVAACGDYLARQVALVQPKIILAVGKFAAQNLLGTDDPVGRMRGHAHEFNGIPLVVTYHPAYLLRSPSQKRKSWADLCLAARLAAEGNA